MIKEIIYRSLEYLFPKFNKIVVFQNVIIKMPYRLRNYFPMDYEKSTMQFLNQFEFTNDPIIDIGAHVGLYTVILSKKSSLDTQVFAFEPLKSNFDYLNKTINLNDLDNTYSYNIAISHKVGYSEFYYSDDVGFNAGSLVSGSLYKNKISKKLIETTTVDHFIKTKKVRKPQLIKIDVEGFEEKVLKGCINTIKKSSPTIILALHPNSIAQNQDSLLTIWKFIKSFDYNIYMKNKMIDRDTFINNTNLFDVILIHKTKSHLKTISNHSN